MKEKKMVCSICGKKLSDNRRLREHILTFHIEEAKELYPLKCEICDNRFEDYGSLLTHVVKVHKDINIVEYYNSYIYGKMRCKHCNELLPYERYSGNFCNEKHYKEFKKLEKGIELKYECEFCDQKFEKVGSLQIHVAKIHKEIDVEEYYNKYVRQESDPDGKCFYCGKQLKFNSFTEGYNRFCYNTDCNIRFYNEKDGRHEKAMESYKELLKNDNTILPNQIGYWTKRGYTEEEAKFKIKERQTTNSVEAIMKREGCSEEDAINKRQEITDKWINNFPFQNYSNVSQELFWSIYEKIKHKYKNIYFATLFNGERVENKNKEFKIKTNVTTRSLDFYVQDIEKCIEFNGTYWHGEVGRGNRTRDEDREKEILETMPELQILHIKEEDYRNDKQKVIQECIEFLNS